MFFSIDIEFHGFAANNIFLYTIDDLYYQSKDRYVCDVLQKTLRRFGSGVSVGSVG